MQQSFQLVSLVFTITPNITCSLPGAITHDRSMDQESDGRDPLYCLVQMGKQQRPSCLATKNCQFVSRLRMRVTTRIAVNMLSSVSSENRALFMWYSGQGNDILNIKVLSLESLCKCNPYFLCREPGRNLGNFLKLLIAHVPCIGHKSIAILFVV